jgi:pyruvate/2-oxoglutarate dehydrogenase complex dihydrolipoamide acyltransferase (E2) component
MTRIIIPQLDANIVDVTVSRWRKTIGEPVSAGETVVELTTDKAVYELEAPASGVLLAVYAQPKSIVPAGYIVGLVGSAGETDDAAAAANEELMLAYRGPAEAPAAVRERAPRVRATPRARRLAQEQGIDLAKVQAETGAAVVDETVLAPYLKS